MDKTAPVGIDENVMHTRISRLPTCAKSGMCRSTVCMVSYTWRSYRTLGYKPLSGATLIPTTPTGKRDIHPAQWPHTVAVYPVATKPHPAYLLVVLQLREGSTATKLWRNFFRPFLSKGQREQRPLPVAGQVEPSRHRRAAEHVPTALRTTSGRGSIRFTAFGVLRIGVLLGSGEK